VPFLEWTLKFGRVDALSQVFGYIMGLMCLIATLSSPIHWHLAPSLDRRSLLAASSPTLHCPARTCGSYSALQRGRPPGVFTSGVGLLSEASQPVGSSIRRGTAFRQGRTRAAIPASDRLPQGLVSAGFWAAAPVSPRYGSCLFALKLHFLSQAGDAVFSTPRLSDLIVLAASSLPAGRALVGWTHSATD
jgi:hypothetical protein